MARVGIRHMRTGTSTGNQTIDFPAGFGTPSGALILYGRAVSLAARAGALLGIGVVDGTRQYTACWGARDNRSLTDTRSHTSKTRCIVIINLVGGTINGEAEFVSFNEDSMTINWTNAPGSNWAYTVIAWTGDEITAQAGLIFTHTDVGVADVVNVSFKLDQLIVFGDGKSFDDTGRVNARQAIGVADRDYYTNEIKQHVFGFRDSNNQPDQHSTLLLNHTGVISQLSLVPGGAFEASFNLENVTDNNFSIVRGTPSEVVIPSFDGNSTGEYAYLAISYSGSLDHDLQLFSTPSEPGYLVTGGFNFKPQGAFQFGAPTSTLGEKLSGNSFINTHMIGCFHLSGQNIPETDEPSFNSRHFSYIHTDSNPNSSAYTRYSEAGMVLFNATGETLCSGDILSFSNDGIEMYWNVAQAAYKWPTLLFGMTPRKGSAS